MPMTVIALEGIMGIIQCTIIAKGDRGYTDIYNNSFLKLH